MLMLKNYAITFSAIIDYRYIQIPYEPFSISMLTEKPIFHI